MSFSTQHVMENDTYFLITFFCCNSEWILIVQYAIAANCITDMSIFTARDQLII